MPPQKGEPAARLRAAVAYSGLKQPAAAKKLNVSTVTLSRMENGRGTITVSDEQVAAAFNVPIEFLQAGWGPLRRPISDVERRLYEMEERLAELEARPAEAPAGQAAIDAAVRHLQGALQPPATPPQDEKPPGTGAETGTG